VDGDVVGDLRQFAPVNGLVHASTSAVDGADWLRGSVGAFTHLFGLPGKQGKAKELSKQGLGRQYLVIAGVF
jgi:hypothetical protein